MATAKINFREKGRDKIYKYNFDMPEPPTKHNLALAISRAMGKTQGETKYTGVPKNYNLVMELLNHNTRMVFPEQDTIDHMKEIFEDANERNHEEKPFKTPCPKCGGRGNIPSERNTDDLDDLCSEACPKCRGHGFLLHRLMWRVGYTTSSRHIIDIDGKDLYNAKQVKNYYEPLLGQKYTMIRTNGGFWLIGDKTYQSKEDFVYDHCRVLNPSLERAGIKQYIKSLNSLDKKEEDEFKRASAEDIKKSNLYYGFGNFDVTFTFLSIKRGRSTLRITSKRKGDSIEIIKDRI